jgi:phage baseplate assembly protein W
MAIKDFSILLEKVETAQTKKDVGIVTGFNAISQYIEHILKTQKGELISDMNMGSDYFSYIFGTNDPGLLELNLSAYIQAAIPKISDVRVDLLSQEDEQLSFQINFSIFDGIKTQNNASCFVEVDLR